MTKANQDSAPRLCEQAQLMQAVLDNVTDGVIAIDAVGCVLSLNASAIRMFGCPPDGAVGQDISKFIPKIADGADGPIRVAVGGPIELTAFHVDGGGFPIELVISAQTFGDRPVFVCIIVDITDRKRSREVLNEAMASIPDGFVIYDDNDRLVECNEAYAELYRHSAPAIKPGATFEEILRYGLLRGQYPEAGETEASREEWLRQRLAQHQAPSRDLVQQLPDGKWLQIRERRTKSGFFVGFRSDVTEIKSRATVLQSIIDSFPGGISVIDKNQHIVAYNDQFINLLGIDRTLFDGRLPALEEVIRSNALRGEYGPGDIEEMVRTRVKTARHLQPHHIERTRADGSVIEIRGKPMPDGGSITTFVDITTRKAAEELISKSEKVAREQAEILRVTLANMKQGLCMFDRDQRLLVWNDRYRNMYGMSDEVVKRGVTLSEILQHRKAAGDLALDIDRQKSELITAITSGRSFRTLNTLSDGRIIEIISSPMSEHGWVSTHQDVTATERAAAEIARLAQHDSLTGLANRARFLEKTDEALARLKRHDERFSVFLMDLDRFKDVNDTMGHPAGDELLRQVGQRIRSCTRDVDVVARLGGDEFAILQDLDGERRDGALILATRLIEVISAPYTIDGSTAVIGASIGIAVAPDDGVDREELIGRADLALYRVKAEGRNAFRFFDEELESAAQTRRGMIVELQNALDRDQFELYYQPLVNLATQTLFGGEALLRWRHPVRGLISPDDFIPFAEETGLIVPIGEWALRKACADAATWPQHLKIAVNLSPVQFHQGSLIDTVTYALVESGLSPDRLDLEITESVLLKRSEENIATMHQMKSIGISIVLDDFGTGYSSLGYIHQFPFDKIKIARTFVQNLGTDASSAPIICTITGLAKGINILTLAEGIETQEQFDLLKLAGCDEGQGYFLGRPVPLATFIAKHLGNGDNRSEVA